MRNLYCPNCGKDTPHKRELGFGTFFAVLLTFGFWLLIIPLYPRRCSFCKSTPPFLSSVRPDLPPPSVTSAPPRPCPFCAEPIHQAAVKCKHCGSQVVPCHAPSLAHGDKRCPDCSFMNHSTAQYCAKCGRKFSF